MLYYDPTEGDTDTRVGKLLLRAARALTGLEELTGADWLITPTTENVLERAKLPAEKTELAEQCRAGILIQRKAGNDALQSIPEWTRILHKMCSWTTRPWLVTIGCYERTTGVPAKVVVDNKVSGWDWNAWLGALTHWQYRGLNGTSGYYLNLPTDSAFTDWCLWQDKQTPDDLADIAYVPRHPQQKIVLPDESVEYHDALRFLLQIPGIGLESALKLWKYCGSLKLLVMLLSDPVTFKQLKKADQNGDKLLAGVGPEVVTKFRTVMGLGERTVDEVIQYETLVPTYDARAFKVTEVIVENEASATPF